MFVSELDDFTGPVFFISNADEPATTFVTREGAADVGLGALSGVINDVEPESIAQVMVAKRMDEVEEKFAFKNAFGRHLSSDKIGVVSCGPEAISATEVWTIVMREDGVALRSVFDKYLAVHDGRLRCDSDEIGVREVWKVKCQAAIQKERKRVKKAQEPRKDKKHVSAEDALDKRAQKRDKYCW